MICGPSYQWHIPNVKLDVEVDLLVVKVEHGGCGVDDGVVEGDTGRANVLTVS